MGNLRLITTATALASLTAFGTAASASDAITFVSWGGAYTASQVKACIEPYKAKTGQEFNIVDYNGGLAEIRTQVEAGNVQWTSLTSRHKTLFAAVTKVY